MINKLKRHLVTMYFTSTGIILTGIIFILYISNINSLEEYHKEKFQTIRTALIYLIENNKTIRSQILSDFESSEKVLIQIKDNQIPFQFKGGWNTDTSRQILFDRLFAKTNNSQIKIEIDPEFNSILLGNIYLFKGDKDDRYLGSITHIPTNKEHPIELNIIYDISSSELYSFKNISPYIIMEVLGLCLLFIIGKILVKGFLSPVENNIYKQKEFIATASHELKSPLAVIQASSSAILIEPEKTGDYIRTIEDECMRMSRLIQDMLFLASSDSHQLTLKEDILDVDDFLIEVYEKFYLFCKQSRHVLIEELLNSVDIKIKADKERLMQVFAILIDNAVSYSPPDSKILIRSSVQTKTLLIEIEDNGIGISDDEKKLVFDNFYRSSKSRSDKNHFGLGLGIAASIIKLMRGRIKIKDTKGGGTTFCILLPIL